MIATYVNDQGEELAFDVPCLTDFRCLAREAGRPVLLEHENGSTLSFEAVGDVATLFWTDSLRLAYCWRGPSEDALHCVGVYLETGWPRSERVLFVPENG